jgi:hypothetical protein
MSDAPCFARGTQILTPSGYVPVENLAPADPVITAAGERAAIRWIGRVTVDIAAHPRPEAVRPIRFAAGSLAPGIPARPLTLSPDHGLFFEGVLVPAKRLVNAATITCEALPAITYLHLELDRHDIIFADAAAVETYLDTGNRDAFTTGAGNFGRTARHDARAAAPLALSGPVLRDIRATIRARTETLGYKRRTFADITVWLEGTPYHRTTGPAARPRYNLPPGGGLATILSRKFVPADLDPAAEDYRPLGIALHHIKLGPKIFDPRALAVCGLHPRAAGDCADWTDGRAILDIPPGAGPLELGIAALPQGWTR